MMGWIDDESIFLYFRKIDFHKLYSEQKRSAKQE
jgi:hypothetical protein